MHTFRHKNISYIFELDTHADDDSGAKVVCRPCVIHLSDRPEDVLHIIQDNIVGVELDNKFAYLQTDPRNQVVYETGSLMNNIQQEVFDRVARWIEAGEIGDLRVEPDRSAAESLTSSIHELIRLGLDTDEAIHNGHATEFAGAEACSIISEEIRRTCRIITDHDSVERGEFVLQNVFNPGDTVFNANFCPFWIKAVHENPEELLDYGLPIMVADIDTMRVVQMSKNSYFPAEVAQRAFELISQTRCWLCEPEEIHIDKLAILLELLEILVPALACMVRYFALRQSLLAN